MYSGDAKSFENDDYCAHLWHFNKTFKNKVSLYELGYICTLLELPFHSESNGIIFNFEHLRSRKLWPYT